MKLNHDCIRDLLIAVENINSRTAWYPVETLATNANLFGKGYSLEELLYTTECLCDAGFIEAKISIHDGMIQRLTWDGHIFLDNIRDPLIWKKTKEASAKVASVSVQTLFGIAGQIIGKAVGID